MTSRYPLEEMPAVWVVYLRVILSPVAPGYVVVAAYLWFVTMLFWVRSSVVPTFPFATRTGTASVRVVFFLLLSAAKQTLCVFEYGASCYLLGNRRVFISSNNGWAPMAAPNGDAVTSARGNPIWQVRATFPSFERSCALCPTSFTS